MKRKLKNFVYNWDAVPLIVDPLYVAALLGCTADRVRKECQSGRLVAFKIGNDKNSMWRINKDDLIAYTKGKTL